MTPRPATRKLGDPLDQKSQYAYLHMSIDASGGPVVHRCHFDLGPLERTEAPLYHHQSLVAAGCIFKADGVIVGLNDPLAIVFGSFDYRRPVDTKKTCFGNPQIPFESFRGQQLDGPLGGSGMIPVSGRFTLQQFYDHLPVVTLPPCFLRVITQDVAPASLAITVDNLLGMEVVPELGVAASLAEDLSFDFGDTGHATGQEILAANSGRSRPLIPFDSDQ